MKWNLAVVFIPISMIVSEAEHFLVHYEPSRMQSYTVMTIYVLEYPFSLLCLVSSCSLCNTQFQCDPLGNTIFPILPARISHFSGLPYPWAWLCHSLQSPCDGITCCLASASKPPSPLFPLILLLRTVTSTEQLLTIFADRFYQV